MGGLRRRRARDRAQRLPAALGHGLPRRPDHRGQRLHVCQWRDRQGDHLPARGARPGQDRHLRRHERARSQQARRGAARSRRAAEARQLPRSRRPRPRGDRRARTAVGQGLRRRNGEPRHHPRGGIAKARQRHVQRDRRPAHRHPRCGVRRQPRHRRRDTGEEPEGEPAAGTALDRVGRRALPGCEVRGRCGERRGLLPRPWLHQRQCRPGRTAPPGRFARRPHPLRADARARARRRAAQGRVDCLRGPHAGRHRSPAIDIEAPDRPVVPRGRSARGDPEGAGDVRRWRLHRVHRVSGTDAGASRSGGSIGGAPRGSRAPHHRGPAVLRQPAHVRRQHDHARHGGAARVRALRGRGVQHRTAQVQRQAPQPARIFQAHRGRGQGRADRQDDRARQRRRRHREGVGAEPERDPVRRRHVAMPKACSATWPSPRPTSSAAARA